MSSISSAVKPETIAGERAIPTVLFDVRLGSIVSKIDFDYDAVSDFMRSNSLTTKQITDTTISFKRNGSWNCVVGQYDPEEKVASIGVAPNNSAVDINGTLSHELWHRIDHAKGRFNGKSGTINKVQNSLYAYGLVANAAGLVLFWGDILFFGARHGMEVGPATVALHALGAAMLAGYGVMYFGINPLEKDARAAERHPVKAVRMTLRRHTNEKHRP